MEEIIIPTESPMKRIQKILVQQQIQHTAIVDDDVSFRNNSLGDETAVQQQADCPDSHSTPHPTSLATDDVNSQDKVSSQGDGDVTIVSEKQPLVDITDLYYEIGKLTESLKNVIHNTSTIPQMQASINELQKDVKTQLASLEGRVLTNEEDIRKMKESISNNNEYMVQYVKPLIKQLNREQTLDKVAENSGKIFDLESQNELDLTLKYELDEQEVESTIQRLLSDQLMEMKAFDIATDTELSSKIDSIKTDSTEKLLKITTDIEDMVEVNKELLTRVSKLEKLKPPLVTNNKPLAKPPDKRPPATIDHEVVILGDSNTTSIDMKEIGHGFRRKRFTCYTIPEVSDFLKTVNVVSQPKKIALHVGTNDVVMADGNVELLTANYRSLLDETRRLFPESRIFVSSIFNRKAKTDKLNTPIQKINNILEKICDSTTKMSFIDNSNIAHRHMFDPKHVNETGFSIFQWNIRHLVFGEVPKHGQMDYSRRR